MRFLLFAAVGLALYAGLYYSAGPKSKTATAAVPSRSQHSLGSILLHFVLGLAALFAIDGAIFHSGFYSSFLKRSSFAGNLALIMDQERVRPKSEGAREIALLGNSRMLEGFSAKAADARATDTSFRFVNLAVPRCELRVWYYALRALDPQADRYRAIVIPIRYANQDRGRALFNDVADVTYAAPFLRCTDAVTLAASFPKWSGKCHAFISCFLRGYAFRDDLHDFLADPATRLRSRASDADFLASRYEHAGIPQTLAGVSIDPQTKEIFVPEHLAAFRAPLQNSLKPRRDRGLFEKYRAKWLGLILEHYAHSSTTIALVQMPRGPLGAAPDSLMREGSIAEFERAGHSFALDPHLFDRLERPEFFADRYHLNSSGRAIFTEILTDELVRRFR